MRGRIMILAVVACMLVGGTACGSDADESAAATTAPGSAESATDSATAESDTADSDTLEPGVTPSSEAEPDTTTAATKMGGNVGTPVDAFCTRAERLAAKIVAVVADPALGDITTLNVEAGQLSLDAMALITANPADAGRVSACVQQVTTALTDIAATVVTAAPAATTTTVGPEGAESAAAFCARVDAVIAQIEATAADPDIEANNAAISALTTEAAAVIAANAGDAGAITACIQRLTEALSS